MCASDAHRDDNPAPMSGRRPALAVLAVSAGVVIGLIDSSPGWDSTGITAGLVFLSAALPAGIAASRPWLWALLVGLPLPVIEIAGSGSTSSVLALGIAALGACVGWAVGRAAGRSAQGSLRE